MEAFFVLSIIFGSITAWVLGPKYLKQRHEERLRALALGGSAPPQEVKQLQADNARLEAERAQLEERMRNLETIVCGVDLELNAKLERVAARQLLLPAPATAAANSSAAIGTALTIEASRGLAFGEPASGARIANRFVIERRLGTGGMGSVFLARDEKLGEPVALKMVRGVHLADASVLERLRREVTAARRVNHPNVVRLHDLGEESGAMFISMEYVAGESVRELLRRHRVIPIPQLREIISQVCDGLEAAHAAGIVHRDLKPENVLLGAKQQVKIIDFGIARINDLQGMTATSLILGTAEYMAPEQVRGRPVDARTDLYAVGVLVYEALTGDPPFHGDSAIATGFAHCTEAIRPARERKADVPVAWDTFVQKALAKEPAQRFDSATAMRLALPAA